MTVRGTHPPLANHVTITPSRSSKHIVLGVLSIAGTLALLYVFLVCCWSAAADAQGAVAFLFAVPIFELGILLSVVLAWFARPWRGGRLALVAAIGFTAFLAVFYGARLVPGLRPFPYVVIHLVADAYKQVTGKTPFEADKGL